MNLEYNLEHVSFICNHWLSTLCVEYLCKRLKEALYMMFTALVKESKILDDMSERIRRRNSVVFKRRDYHD